MTCIKKKLSKSRLVEFILQACLFSPIPEDPKQSCKLINGFVLRDSKVQIKETELGVDLNAKMQKGEAWKRPKMKTHFPLVILDILPVKESKNKEVCKFELGVIDKTIHECKGCSYCEKRTEAEVYRDVSILRRQITEYLCTVICAKTWKRNESGLKDILEYDWFTISELDKMVIDGDIDGYIKDGVATSKWLSYTGLSGDLKHAHWNLRGNYLGSYIYDWKIEFDLDCEPTEFNTDFSGAKPKIVCC